MIKRICNAFKEIPSVINLSKAEFFLTIAGACVPFKALEEQLEKERHSGFNSFLEEVKEIEEIDFQDIPTENKTEL